MLNEFVFVFIGVMNVRLVLFLLVSLPEESETHFRDHPRPPVSPQDLLAVAYHVSWKTFNAILCIAYHTQEPL